MKFSGKEVLPGEANFMSIKELEILAKEFGLKNDLCSDGNINSCFNLSEESIVDELSTTKLL